MLLAILLPVLQKVHEEINDGKKNHFAKKDENDFIVKMCCFRKKMGHKILDNVVYCQFAYCHDSCQYGGVKKGCLPF